MIELLIIMFKLFFKITLVIIMSILCKLRYINHNYSIIDISAPKCDNWINDLMLGPYYDFTITYKCNLCNKEKKIYYYMNKQGRWIENKEIKILDVNNIKKDDYEFCIYSYKNSDYKDISFLFKKLKTGIYRIPLKAFEDENILNYFIEQNIEKSDYLKCIIEKEYLTFSLINRKEE